MGLEKMPAQFPMWELPHHRTNSNHEIIPKKELFFGKPIDKRCVRVYNGGTKDRKAGGENGSKAAGKEDTGSYGIVRCGQGGKA
jgi:hypothetical protein